jgi:CheY-like chemotaxis protein/anti-sigma regulatory factor (Ser/Thr protein kinase)
MWVDQASAKGLSFTVDVARCPAQVEGDAARVRQIVFNLLSNALKFTARGGIWVTAEGAEDGELRIAVRDTGIGIPADKHQEIFESFKQADGATTRKFGGTGLGLAIVRNIALAMGGDVRVESVEGQGTAFTLDMPFVAAELAAPEPTGAGPLLIVDRNPISRSMLKAVLEKRAGSVVFAGSLLDAERAVASGGIATMLIDDATAKAAGEDFHAALAQLASAAKTTGTATAILWATPGDEDRAALLATGIGQIIAKPIAGPALATALYSSRYEEVPLASRAA